MTKVKCSVDSCVYWEKGDRCNADAIEIDYNLMGGDTAADFFTEFAAEPGSTARGKTKRTTAGTLAKTRCETMRPREKEKGKSRETDKKS